MAAIRPISIRFSPDRLPEQEKRIASRQGGAMRLSWTEGGFMMNLPAGLTLAENTQQRKRGHPALTKLRTVIRSSMPHGLEQLKHGLFLSLRQIDPDRENFIQFRCHFGGAVLCKKLRKRDAES